MRTIWSLLGATLLLTACGTNQQEQMAFQNTIPIEPNDKSARADGVSKHDSNRAK